jgi:hypothetical protein
VSLHIQTAASPTRWAAPLLLVPLLTGSGCFSLTPYECTAADTTHSCCLKKNPRAPEVCDGLEGAETVAFRIASTTTQGTAPSGTAVATAAGAAVGRLIGVLIQGDEEDLDELQDELDQTVVGRDADGEPVTRAMELGKEKHKESFKCIEEKLGGLIPGHLLIEQRYCRQCKMASQAHEQGGSRSTPAVGPERRTQRHRGARCSHPFWRTDTSTLRL